MVKLLRGLLWQIRNTPEPQRTMFRGGWLLYPVGWLTLGWVDGNPWPGWAVMAIALLLVGRSTGAVPYMPRGWYDDPEWDFADLEEVEP